MLKLVLFAVISLVFVTGTALAGQGPQGYDILNVQREEVFEFAQKPQITRDGDNVSITFESKAFCDVTVVIEDSGGRIIRHLASGVLGSNAPEPFQKNSKRQTVVWDGKDDAGAYVDDLEAVRVRVSLGLKPQFERTLYWHPGKTAGPWWAIAAGTDGVYVFTSGRGIDHIRKFDHDGNYVRTVYPFPSAEIEGMEGLIFHRFPDGAEVPIKPNWLQSTLLMSGDNCHRPTYQDGRYDGIQSKRFAYGGMNGMAGHGLAAHAGRLALIGHGVSRFTVEGGGVGDISVHGPDLAYRPDRRLWEGTHVHSGTDVQLIRPKRATFCPDGEWLYLARYNETLAGHGGVTLWRHRIKRVRYDGDDAPEVFVGSAQKGDADGEFNMPADVAVDSQGRVYVADHKNDRVQVFDPDGTYLQNISVRRPSQLDVHPETGEIFVFSWALPLDVGGRNNFLGTYPSMERRGEGHTYFRLTRFSALDEARELDSWDLHEVTGLTRTRPSNINIYTAVDFESDPPRVWITAPSPVGARNPSGLGVVLLELDGNQWTVKRDLRHEAARSITRTGPAAHHRQRLYVNHADGMLYLLEGDSSHGKATKQALRFDPNTGRMRAIDLPMSTEDMAFDIEGHAYLRTSEMLVRYDPTTWREVPFDYGEERDSHHFGSGGSERSSRVLSGAIFPGNRGWHHGGMHVAANGDIVVSALYSVEERARRSDSVHDAEGFQPRMYPGRRYDYGGRFGGILVHVLDRHGQMVHADAIPGLSTFVNGTAIDANGDIYLLEAATAVIDGERHFNDHAGTLMKVTPGESRLLAPSGAPVPLGDRPDRPTDLNSRTGTAWAENAHWMYPGVGWGGFNAGTGCACPNARFALDYLARSFTPEIDRYNVGVLDSAGNLILRVGQYGNVDDGEPLVERGGPPNTRSIGGDETALKHAPYVATHTDHRLFIADPGNARIVSVKLGYHVDETIALKDIPEKE